MTAGVVDLVIDAKAGSSRAFIYCNPGSRPGVPGPPVDVTGWHATFTVRSSYGDGILVMLNDDDESLGGIDVGTTDGRIGVTMTAEQTALLPGYGVYDLLVTPPGSQPFRLVQGNITAAAPVTP